MSPEFVASEFKAAVSKLFRGRNQGPNALIGREEEFADLDAAWSNSTKKNVVTIVAWGGVGKTSLVANWTAMKLAQADHSGIERYFDWSFYSQGTRREGGATGASYAASADLFLKEALEFFGDKGLAASNAGAWQKGERLTQLVRKHRTLLVLDGIEPLQDAKTGELRDDGLRSLLRGLAQDNPGLCLVTTREHLPELNRFHQTAPEWKLDKLSDEAGAALLTKLGVNGSEPEKHDLSASVKGHALTLTLLGNYLRKAHHGDIRRVDRVDFRKVNEKEQGGHAFRVIAAYELWFEENNCCAQLGILRMLGLFDRPATPDCLAALRTPPILGLSETVASLSEDDWNEAVTHLVELNLVEEQLWEPRRVFGYNETIANKVMDADKRRRSYTLGRPTQFESAQSHFVYRRSLDAHPLLREFFAIRLQETNRAGWKSGHARLFIRLQASTPYWPEGLDGLQPLFQAVVHGCEGGLHEVALVDTFHDRIERGESYASMKLGAFSTSLATLSCFFQRPWIEPTPDLPERHHGALYYSTAYCLKALGRLDEAVEPMHQALKLVIRDRRWAEAAIGAINCCDLLLTQGEIRGALALAKQAVQFADRGEDMYRRVANHARLAGALQQQGEISDSLAHFEEAEKLQSTLRGQSSELYSIHGFLYAELLLKDAEISAWKLVIASVDAAERHVWVSNLPTKCEDFRRRTKRAMALAEKGNWPLDIALHHLTLARIAIYRAILDTGSERQTLLNAADKEVGFAMDWLRRSGENIQVPRGLLTRAWLRAAQGQPKLAQADLDEAQQIAERGPMRLHLADIHLHRARLFRDKEELKRARALIEQCEYWRRKQELEDAEEASKRW